MHMNATASATKRGAGFDFEAASWASIARRARGRVLDAAADAFCAVWSFAQTAEAREREAGRQGADQAVRRRRPTAAGRGHLLGPSRRVPPRQRKQNRQRRVRGSGGHVDAVASIPENVKNTAAQCRVDGQVSERARSVPETKVDGRAMAAVLEKIGNACR